MKVWFGLLSQIHQVSILRCSSFLKCVGYRVLCFLALPVITPRVRRGQWCTPVLPIGVMTVKPLKFGLWSRPRRSYGACRKAKIHWKCPENSVKRINPREYSWGNGDTSQRRATSRVAELINEFLLRENVLSTVFYIVKTESLLQGTWDRRVPMDPEI